MWTLRKDGGDGIISTRLIRQRLFRLLSHSSTHDFQRSWSTAPENPLTASRTSDRQSLLRAVPLESLQSKGGRWTESTRRAPKPPTPKFGPNNSRNDFALRTIAIFLGSNPSLVSNQAPNPPHKPSTLRPSIFAKSRSLKTHSASRMEGRD